MRMAIAGGVARCARDEPTGAERWGRHGSVDAAVGAVARCRPSWRGDYRRRGLVDRRRPRRDGRRRAWAGWATPSSSVHSKVRPWSGTFADVDRSARALAGALRARGVGAGDVVVLQLPNWVEAGITFWAAAYLGAVVVPDRALLRGRRRSTTSCARPEPDGGRHRRPVRPHRPPRDLRGAARRPTRAALAGGRRHARRPACPPRAEPFDDAARRRARSTGPRRSTPTRRR